MKNLIATFILLNFLALCSYAQTASVQWNLTSDSLVTTTIGSSVGQGETFSSSATDSSLNMQIRDYAASNGGQRINLGAKPWPNQLAIDTGRYIQFAVRPSSGFSLHVSSVSLEIGGGGTGSMRAAIYYSTDPMFAGSTVLISSLVLPSSAWYDPSPSYTLSADITASQIFYLRIYPWYNSSNASTSKYIYLRNVIIAGTTFSVSGTTVPTVTTVAVSSITSTSAKSGGTVVYDGGSSITLRGVCWNTTGAPTIANAKTTDGTGIGLFTSTLTGLTNGTTYYFRAYATNSVGTSYGSEYSFVAVDPLPPLVAFPGAEGFGAHVTGGRGGAVYVVTTLKDTTTAGSLRYAINQTGARTIVFRVSGTIYLKSALSIINGNLTIAGQTAPGGGICIAGYTPSVNCDNVIVRFVRFRLGDVNDIEDDAFNGRDHSNIIIDHCTMTWSVDECASFYDNSHFTMQWCIIGESLYRSVHEKGNHGYGGIQGGMGATFHHNLYLHNSSRNPRFCGGRYHLATASSEIVDFRNNVIYNWGFNSAYGGENGNQNMINNYFKPGPATRTTGGVNYRIVQPSDTLNAKPLNKWYVDGNYMYGSSTVTANNWNGGVQPYDSSVPADSIKLLSPLTVDAVTTETAEQAYVSVLANVGVTVPKRDSLEERYIREVTNGTATYGGAYPNSSGDTVRTGIIDSQSRIGGWPVLNSTTAPTDNDNDGMPDAWETAQGLNPNNASDRNTISASGYTYLEVYLNALVSGTTNSVAVSTQPTTFSLAQNYPNPFNPSTNLHFTVQQKGWTTLKVYNVLGQEVATLFNDLAIAGHTYEVTFDGKNLSSGIYIARLVSSNSTKIQKMMLIK